MLAFSNLMTSFCYLYRGGFAQGAQRAEAGVHGRLCERWERA